MHSLNVVESASVHDDVPPPDVAGAGVMDVPPLEPGVVEDDPPPLPPPDVDGVDDAEQSPPS